MKIIQKISQSINKFFYSKKKKCKINIGDIFLQQGISITETQFIATSRCLDIERYCKEGLDNFEYKNSLCNAMHGNLHNEMRSNRDFKRLIDSFCLDGYNSSYPILCNGDGYLIDGNHRCGACLYFKIEEINAIFSNSGRTVHKDFNFIVGSGIKPYLISSVIEEFSNIQKWLIESGNTFALVASGFSDSSEYLEFENRVAYLCTVLKVHESKTSILIQYSLNEPLYKCSQNHLISAKCIQIERILKNLFPSIQLNVSKSCYEGHYIIKEFYSNMDNYKYYLLTIINKSFLARGNEFGSYEWYKDGEWVKNDTLSVRLTDSMMGYGDGSPFDYEDLTKEQAISFIESSKTS